MQLLSDKSLAVYGPSGAETESHAGDTMNWSPELLRAPCGDTKNFGKNIIRFTSEKLTTHYKVHGQLAHSDNTQQTRQ